MKMEPLVLLLGKGHIVVNLWGGLESLSMVVLAYQELVVAWCQDRSIQERY